MIDNEKKPMNLIEALNEHLPMRAYATLPLVKAVRRQVRHPRNNRCQFFISGTFKGNDELTPIAFPREMMN